MANGGAWSVRNRGGGAYNQDVQDHVEEMNEAVQELNLKEYGANTVHKYRDAYLFCDSSGDTRFLGFIESWMYKLGLKKAEDFK